MKKYFAIALISLSIVACNTQKKVETPAPQAQEEKAPEQTTTMKGRLTMGHEVSAFIPENETVSYWIDDPSHQMDSLYKQTVGANAQAYAEVTCEVEVKKLPKSTDGFAAEYGGNLEVVKIIKMEAVNPKNDIKDATVANYVDAKGKALVATYGLIKDKQVVYIAYEGESPRLLPQTESWAKGGIYEADNYYWKFQGDKGTLKIGNQKAIKFTEKK